MTRQPWRWIKTVTLHTCLFLYFYNKIRIALKTQTKVTVLKSSAFSLFVRITDSIMASTFDGLPKNSSDARFAVRNVFANNCQYRTYWRFQLKRVRTSRMQLNKEIGAKRKKKLYKNKPRQHGALEKLIKCSCNLGYTTTFEAFADGSVSYFCSKAFFYIQTWNNIFTKQSNSNSTKQCND